MHMGISDKVSNLCQQHACKHIHTDSWRFSLEVLS